MEADVITVTSKGQISIPVKIQRASHIQQGDKLLIITDDDTITLRKITKNSFKDLRKHSEATANKLWSNPDDEVWDKV